MANQSNDPDVIAGDGPGGDYVSPRGIMILAIYLLAFTLFILWELKTWWPHCDATTSTTSTASASGASAPLTSDASASMTTDATTTDSSNLTTDGAAGQGLPANKNPSSSATAVKVTSVMPNSGSVEGGTPVDVNGEGFQANPTVLFGASAATNVQQKSAALITAKTPAHAEGPVDVTVTNLDQTSNKLAAGYTYDTCLTECRSRLFILVLLAGALGGCFHALRSFWMFVGNRNLKQSWALMYIILPINGAALAFIFFIVISAGSGFFAEPKGSNSCFWIIGIAALVGLFSQEAAEKLKKVATAFFTDVPPKADPLAAKPSITIDPAEGPVAGGTTVKITGKGFTDKSVVTFGSLDGTNLKFESSSSIMVDTPAADKAGPVDVTVTTPGSAAKAVKPGGYKYI
jgi:hypothetical protein